MKNIVCTLILMVASNLLFAQWQPDNRLTSDLSISNTSWNNSWCIASTGSIVHVMYWDNRNGNFEIYYKRSSTSGISWAADLRLTNSADSSSVPSVALSGSNVHLVWMDKRNGNSEIYYKSSTDDGITWGTDTRLTNNSADSWFPSLAVSGSNLYVVWQDRRDGNWEIYFKRSIDAGASWESDMRLTTSSNDAHTPSIAITNTGVHVVWVIGNETAYNTFYKRSSDAGSTWGSETQISTNSSELWNPPSIAAAGTMVHIVWNDSHNGIWRIFYKNSSDDGITWGTDNGIVSGTANSIFPNIAVSEAAVHITWFDLRDLHPQIYYKRSTDNGNNWEADTRITNTDSAAVTPNIAISGSVVHLVWSDRRNGNNEIYYKRNPTGNPIGIINISSEKPFEFKLKQNYPNPFNPKTIINFQLPTNNYVKLIIYDEMGREVTTLVNEQLNPGTYEVEWNAGIYSSGIYFYRIQTGSFSETKRMVLIK